MSHLEGLKAYLFTASNLLDSFCSPRDNKRRKQESVQRMKCITVCLFFFHNECHWRTCISARSLSREGKLWSQTVWHSLVCEPSVLFGTGQCLQNTVLCKACLPLQEKKVTENSEQQSRFSLHSQHGICFAVAHTLLFLFPTIIAKVRNIIILYRSLQVLQNHTAELFGELLPHIIWHLQIFSQPLLCVTCWPGWKTREIEGDPLLSLLPCLTADEEATGAYEKFFIKLCFSQCGVVVTYGLKLRLYGGLLTIIWLSADTITKMRMGMTCTKRARPPCKENRYQQLNLIKNNFFS